MNLTDSMYSPRFIYLDFFVDMRNLDGGGGWPDVIVRRDGSKSILLTAAGIQSFVKVVNVCVAEPGSPISQFAGVPHSATIK